MFPRTYRETTSTFYCSKFVLRSHRIFVSINIISILKETCKYQLEHICNAEFLHFLRWIMIIIFTNKSQIAYSSLCQLKEYKRELKLTSKYYKNADY